MWVKFYEIAATMLAAIFKYTWVVNFFKFQFLGIFFPNKLYLANWWGLEYIECVSCWKVGPERSVLFMT